MNNSELIQTLNKDLALQLPEKISYEEMIDKLSIAVNNLLQSDFHKLVSLLYRIDVSEPKLRYLLKENPDENAGRIIATLIIERQLQKIKSREEFSRKDTNIDEEEKW